MEYTTSELELQDAQLLPEREALSLFNGAGITAWNGAVALNTLAFGSSASATATQAIVVVQS